MKYLKRINESNENELYRNYIEECFIDIDVYRIHGDLDNTIIEIKHPIDENPMEVVTLMTKKYREKLEQLIQIEIAIEKLKIGYPDVEHRILEDDISLHLMLMNIHQ